MSRGDVRVDWSRRRRQDDVDPRDLRLLHVDAGTIACSARIRSASIATSPARSATSQRFALRRLSIDENIAFFAEIHGVRDYHSRRDRLLEMTHHEFRAARPINSPAA